MNKIIFLLSCFFCVFLTAEAAAQTATPVAAGSIMDANDLVLDLSLRDGNALIKPLLGVVSGPEAAQGSAGIDLTKHFLDVGITSIRNHDYLDDRLDIEQILQVPDEKTYPSWLSADANNPKHYYWDESDEQIDKIIGGGFELLLRLGGEAWCPQRPHAFHGPQDMVMEKNWMVAADNVLKRYKKWKGKTALSYIAIWSEFPGVAYWDRTAQEFVAFWTKAINVFKYNHPDLKFGGPGFSAEATDEVRRGISGVVAEFLKQLYLRKTKPDWIGWHLYANDPSEALEAARAYELLLAGKAPFQNVPWAGKFFFDEVTLLVDSYGVRTANEETTQIADGAREAAIVTGHWIAFEHTAVMGAWLYRANNIVLASASDEQPAWSQGLFKADLVGTYTPKAHAFRLWSRMAKEFGHKLQTPPYLVDQIAQQKLWVLAGQAASGKGGEAKVGVLLANPGAQPVSFTPILKQIKPKGALYVVDGVDNGRSAKAWEGTNIVVPPRSVVLATFE